VSDSPEDSVDTIPVWTTTAPYSLFFTRGKGTEYHYDPKKVMVPGQRIWQQPAGASAKQITQGTMLTADYFPYPSPDGKLLLFVRVDQALRGSLYLSAQGKETELLRFVTGDIGYYANYLPQWISVYWTSEPAPNK
jgi:Tol biopolymer transport system component